MYEDSEKLIIFRIRYEIYKYKMLLFGLTNGFATFQRFINDIFIKYLNDFCFAYINDNLIYLKNEAKYFIYVKNNNSDFAK